MAGQGPHSAPQNPPQHQKQSGGKLPAQSRDPRCAVLQLCQEPAARTACPGSARLVAVPCMSCPLTWWAAAF